MNDSDKATFEDVLERQASAIRYVTTRIDGLALSRAVQRIHDCSGRCVFLGMGKMGAVGRKAAATFASLGCPAMFVQPSEALHGDLGMITNHDVVLALSYSGETDEVLRVVETVRPWGVSVLAMTKGYENSLARLADAVLDVRVPAEAIDEWPVPTCSTTATLAVCDALAVVVMQKRKFSLEDFAKLHPGGSLGRRLRVRVADVMHSGTKMPLVLPTATLREAIVEMTQKSLGATMVADSTGRLVGLLTDGDVRRTVQKHENPLEIPVENLMTRQPQTWCVDGLAAAALAVMESQRVTVLPVMDQSQLVGIVHFHDLVRARLA
jgi:arabinose-5-phosphate isomerase